ncbi:MAG TPA: tetratricopeptide repeat protein [Roseiflexaceae bacterium]|nr:tetratricopeptide repeat protein [Roseiflexaceae bacterium]
MSEQRALGELLHHDRLQQSGPGGRLAGLTEALPPLVGRASLLQELLGLFAPPAVRLVTLTGPGGTGKTRLALQAAVELAHRYADGVCVIDLVPLSTPDLVPVTIAARLGERGDRPLAETLRDRHILLLLDNFEHLLAAAPFVGSLLSAVPSLDILITSRTALRLPGERALLVPPLELPDLQRLPLPEQLRQNASVALFSQRAETVDPDFKLDNANAAAVAAICVRLDGLPLAIELAAARSHLLSPCDMLDRLDNRFVLLRSTASDRSGRQQTLGETLDWSYNLLEPSAQRLLATLGTFAGGAALEAIAQVVADTPTQHTLAALQDDLDALLNSSLLRRNTGSDGEPRYSMLETIHAYARERLAGHTDAPALIQRHSAYYLELAEQAAPKLIGPEQARWLARLDDENADLRAAFERLLAGGDADGAARLVTALLYFWRIRGRLYEGRCALKAALAHSERMRPATRARALLTAGRIARELGDLTEAAMSLEQSLRLLRAEGNQAGVSDVLNHLGVLAYDQGRFDDAERLHQECLELRRRLGYHRGMAGTLTNLGEVARQRGDYARALALHRESLDLFQQTGDGWGAALAQLNLGVAAALLGEHSEAERALMACLWLCVQLSDKGILTECLEGLAMLAALGGQAERAARLSGGAARLRDLSGSTLPPLDRAALEQRLAPAREQVGDAAFTSAWAAGYNLSTDELVACALE